MAQVLQLEPANELVFKGPFNKNLDVNLTLRNPTEEDVYFKVKTTAPKYYCVRPNSGIIGPNEAKQIQIVLQPIGPDDQDKDMDNSRHKFLIQSAYASSIQTQEEVPEEQMTTEQFWKYIDSTKIMDSKLGVNFIRDDEPVIRPPLSPSVNEEENAVKGQAWDKPSRVTNKEASTPTSSVDIQAQLQPERDLRKMYQEEKDNLEKENYILQLPIPIVPALILAVPNPPPPDRDARGRYGRYPEMNFWVNFAMPENNVLLIGIALALSFGFGFILGRR